jgi:hypothetical protein
MPRPPRDPANPPWNWAAQTIRGIALNPLYIGKRVYQVDAHSPVKADRLAAIVPDVEYDEDRMPHLIDRATFWRAYRNLTSDVLPEGHVLAGKRRKTTRNGPRSERWLLSSIARCAECGSPMIAKRMPATCTYEWGYACAGDACTGIPVEVLDGYVLKVLAGLLSDLEVADELTGVTDADTAEQARGDAEQARAELDRMWRQVDAGEIDAEIATRAKRRLEAAIADAERRLRLATLPDTLSPDLVGAQAEAGLRRMYDAGEQIKLRQIVRTVAGIRVHAVGRRGVPGRGAVPARFRTSFRPLMPAPGEWVPPADYEPWYAERMKVSAARKAQGYISAGLRERIIPAILASPEKADKPLMRDLGLGDSRPVRRIREELEEAGQIPVIRHQGRSGPVNHGYLIRRLPAAAAAADQGGGASARVTATNR